MNFIFTRLLFGPLIRLYIRKIKNEENLPQNSFIAVANHTSFADDFIFPYIVLRKRKSTPFTIFVNSRFYHNWFFKFILNHYGATPVHVKKNVDDDQERRKMNQKALGKAVNLLKNGGIFFLFPEGGRSTDGNLKKGKIGTARIALQAKVPIIPIGIKGSDNIWPRGKKLPRFKRADVVIGEPLYFSHYYGKEENEKILDEVTQKIMKKIGKLTGKEYHH